MALKYFRYQCQEWALLRISRASSCFSDTIWNFLLISALEKELPSAPCSRKGAITLLLLLLKNIIVKYLIWPLGYPNHWDLCHLCIFSISTASIPVVEYVTYLVIWRGMIRILSVFVKLINNNFENCKIKNSKN